MLDHEYIWCAYHFFKDKYSFKHKCQKSRQNTDFYFFTGRDNKCLLLYHGFKILTHGLKALNFEGESGMDKNLKVRTVIMVQIELFG